MSIGELLLKRGLITAEHLAAATRARKRTGQRLDKALVEMGCVSEQQVLEVTSEQLGIAMVDLADVKIDVETLRALPRRLVFRRGLVPLKKSNGTLRLATSDPFDLYSIDEIRMLTGLEIEPVLAPAEEIEKVIKAYYGVGGETVDEMMDSTDLEIIDQDAPDDGDLLEMAQEASVIKLVNEVFLEAIKERATDIHIEPYENNLIIRYRIDGVLQHTTMPVQIRRFQAAIISRIKIMANLNIAEKRLPQDGRIEVKMGGRQFDVRVSVIPMLAGEGVVMRLLDRSSAMLSLPQLGMQESTFSIFHDVIARPHGILLVTGPTGSGKTTTLYAALEEIVSPAIKVVTIEDPVEYNLEGVNQIQVQPKIGLTFARGLRHILRHDPDVIMIGEIRDLETAEAAVQAALTGHLVFSTLHTNDAASSATRLLDMGVEPFLITSTLDAAMAQRLIRTICLECKQQYTPDPAELPPDFEYTPGQPLWRGEGCRKCRGTGYYGRTGLFELMVTSRPIREKIMARAPAGEVLAAAQAEGLHLLREDGWKKVRDGLTTLEEVVRATKA